MKIIDLNGIWNFAFRPSVKREELNLSEEHLSEWISVPGCFDTIPHHYCQRGCAIYSRTFELEKEWRTGWLRIDGMGLRGRFWLDDRFLGDCALPYTLFELETGALAPGQHRITAILDNNFDPEKMKLFFPYYDFYAFGGFYHGISLRLSNEANPPDRIQIRTLDFRTGKLELSFLFKKGPAPETFEAALSINGEPEKVYTVREGRLTLDRPDLPLWSPESPAVHTLKAKIGSDTVTETFGIREVRTEGKKILLNGEAVYLKGFNRHESSPIGGAATTLQEMVTDLQHLKSLQANFIRGCHYPQSQEFLDLCDRMGFLVWEESLGWGNTEKQMKDPEFIRLQMDQTLRMVRNSFNHPSVIIFAFLNENDSTTQPGADLCRKLAETIRAERSGRLVTYATCKIMKDQAFMHMDIIAYNTYPGWLGTGSETDPMDEIAPKHENIVRHFREECPDKPIIVSETGCCAIYGQRDEAGAQWSEEFQAEYLAKAIDTVFSSPEITGLCLWQMNDAKSYHRTGAEIRGKPLSQNLAGVYDQYRRPKIAASVVAEKFTKIGK